LKETVNLEEDASDASVSCVQSAEVIRYNEAAVLKPRQVFKRSASIAFKSQQIIRYYDPNAGSYISQDPIGLVGENPTLYSHVKSPNSQLDLLGLDVYALVATHDGWYPVYEYGTKDPIAYTKLNKGDVYKIGETQHPKTRYSQVRLDEARINRSKATAVAFDADGNIIPAGVKMKPISQGGTKKADRQLENSLLKKYNEEHGHLPAGNKHYH